MWWKKSEDKQKKEISNKMWELLQLLQVKLKSIEAEVQEIQLKIKKKIFKKELDRPEEDNEIQEKIENDDGFGELRQLRKDLKP